jgi:hypothetical protein
VPDLPARPEPEERTAPAGRVSAGVIRAPHLHQALRAFCLGAFAAMFRELDEGGDLPFAFEEHEGSGRPTLYEYRPLVRQFLEDRSDTLSRLSDAVDALDELEREPAAAIFARAHAGLKLDPREALMQTVLLPLLVETAEACGGFDWDDQAFERAYERLEHSVFGTHHAYGAVAPVVGVSIGGIVDLGRGLRLRHVASGELAAHWPQARGLLPEEFERAPDRLCVLELEEQLAPENATPPDAPGELADAVTALRLLTAGPVAAGPVLFERLDWRPFGIRPVLPIAATAPPGETVRIDPLTGDRARRLRERLARVDGDRELGEALDRWELSLFQSDPFASEQLRGSLEAALGAGDGLFAASLRAAALLGETPRDRADVLRRLRLLGTGDEAESTGDLVRRVLVEVLESGDRGGLVLGLDEALLGLRPKPTSTLEPLAAAGAL